MNRDELLAKRMGCPFCGELPEFYTGDNPGYMVLVCESGKCTVNPKLKIRVYYELNNETADVEELVAKWNTRTELERFLRFLTDKGFDKNRDMVDEYRRYTEFINKKLL